MWSQRKTFSGIRHPPPQLILVKKTHQNDNRHTWGWSNRTRLKWFAKYVDFKSKVFSVTKVACLWTSSHHGNLWKSFDLNVTQPIIHTLYAWWRHSSSVERSGPVFCQVCFTDRTLLIKLICLLADCYRLYPISKSNLTLLRPKASTYPGGLSSVLCPSCAGAGRGGDLTS